MNTAAINARSKAKRQPQQNQWVEEAKETLFPKTTQVPEVAREASVDKIINEEKVTNILRDFSKQLAYFWGT